MKGIHTNTIWNWLYQQHSWLAIKECTTTANQRLSSSKQSTVPSISSITKKSQVRSFAQKIAEVRSVLAISMLDLAAILSVTPRTIYGYMDGLEPAEGAETPVMRMKILQLLCKKIRESELALPCNQILRRKNQQGESLQRLLETGALAEADLVVFIAAEEEQQRENHRRIALMKKKKNTQKLANPESISAPYYFE